MTSRPVDHLNLSEDLKTLVHQCYNLPLSNTASLEQHANTVLGSLLDPLHQFLATLSALDRSRALQICLVLYFASNQRFTPRVLQLQAALETLSGRDSIINAGTSAGKTICMALPALMTPNRISVIISPLKRLMATQAKAFERYGLRSIHLNGDTPNDEALWKKVAEGYYSVVVVSPESADTTPGVRDCDAPRFSRLIQRSTFTRLVKHFFFDEGHHIYVDGLPAHGLGAFRPSYGRLIQLRVFCKQATFQVLSGTLPPHFQRCISDNLSLRTGFTTVNASSNSANLVYSSAPLVGSLAEFRNFDFTVGSQFKGIIFVDKRELALQLARYLDNHSGWPSNLRGRGVVRTYYSSHSLKHLEKVFTAFNDPAGSCRILVATSGLAEGIDSAVVRWIVQAGLISRISDLRQRYGRAGRDGLLSCICMLLYEDWVLQIDLDAFPRDAADPDTPSKRLDKNSKKPARIGRAMVELVQNDDCIRSSFVQYFHDWTVNNVTSTSFWCCSSKWHPDHCIYYQEWFTRAPITQKEIDKLDTAAKLAKKAVRRREKSRKVVDRKPLIEALLRWRSDQYEMHPLRGFRTEQDILSAQGLKDVARIAPTRLSTAVVAELLKETDEWTREWAERLVQFVVAHDKAASVSPLPEQDMEVSSDDEASSESSDEEPLVVTATRQRTDASLCEVASQHTQSSAHIIEIHEGSESEEVEAEGENADEAMDLD
ncbi:P-loop containing nucleoside triphosphate hydrolase protein [Peniophora sp. CONT]|nr:P-loop containing nucleoside triphosphate hydrolase protein [Peniophora sp. CONT]